MLPPRPQFARGTLPLVLDVMSAILWAVVALVMLVAVPYANKTNARCGYGYIETVSSGALKGREVAVFTDTINCSTLSTNLIVSSVFAFISV